MFVYVVKHFVGYRPSHVTIWVASIHTVISVKYIFTVTYGISRIDKILRSKFGRTRLWFIEVLLYSSY